MKKHHTTFVLLTLFFTGMIALWWADYAEVPTGEERLKQKGLVLPALLDTRPDAVRRLVIERSPDESRDNEKGEEFARRLVFERRDAGRWRMLEPLDTLADPSRLDVLVRNLKELPRSPDAGTIHEPPANYGLAPPAATISVFGADPKVPIATLEVGKVVKDRLYVHPTGQKGIEVVDALRIKGLNDPVSDWREKAIFTLPSFQVAGFSVKGPDRDLKVERSENRWKLTQPIAALADEPKVEGVVGELTSLRVVEGENGFVADNVRDFKPFGLDRPSMTIELTPPPKLGKAQVLHVGSAAPGTEGRLYARRGTEDDVILIEGKGIHDLGTQPNALRSQNVVDITPDRVVYLGITSRGHDYALARGRAGWSLIGPSHAGADKETVQTLLSGLAGLQTFTFLGEKEAKDAGVDSPATVIKVWQTDLDGKEPSGRGSKPEGKPRVVLKLGKYDALRKAVYARVEGDPSILVLPESVRNLLPKGPFAFRDRTVVDVDPARVTRLSVRWGGREVSVEPDTKSGKPNHWRMVAPVEASANDEAVTRALTVLKDLRAEEFVSDKPDESKATGLDAPILSVSWTTQPTSSPKGSTEPKSGTLRVGAQVAKSESRYAALKDEPMVFTLAPAVLAPFRDEFHDQNALSFDARKVERVVLRWRGRTLALARRSIPKRGPTGWEPEPGYDPSGFDLSRVEPLVTQISQLKVGHFLQYAGPIPASTGLANPGLVIEVTLGGRQGSRILRVGDPGEGGQPLATTATGAEGPVFRLTDSGWADLIRSGDRGSAFPANVFAPAPK